MRLRTFCLFVSIAFVLFLPASVRAQSPIVVEKQTLEMNFPKGMHFTLQASSSAPIQSVVLTVRQRGVALGSRYTPPFVPSPHIRVSYEWNFQSFAFGGYLPPGTHGEYTWHIQDAAGNKLDTPPAAYVVHDSSQKWRELSNDKIRLSWHAGDALFGQTIFERASTARDFFAHELHIENVDPLEIFIYADKQEFFNSLPPFSAEWTGGRMFPEFGVIMINFGPENLDWGLRAASHELSHAILRAKIRGTIGELSVPHWLDEGLAVYNETDAHAPDEQFESAFQLAVRRNALIPLRSMQLRFPDDSAQAQLAYGQSYSAVKFMIQEYGQTKFAELLEIYQQGSTPDEGLTRVYGMNQDELENAWRKEIGAPPREVSSARLPTLGARPTFEVSSALLNTTTPAPETTATPEPTHVAVIETPSSANSIPAPALPTSGLCGGALAMSGLIILGMTRRKAK